MAQAHESRPAYLEINETLPGRYDVLWRTPLNAGMRLPIVLKFPDGVDNVGEPATRELPDSLVERRIIKDPKYGGKAHRVCRPSGDDYRCSRPREDAGWSGIDYADSPSQPWFELSAAPSKLRVAALSALGIEHILGGIDHLLFILALMILVKGTRRLIVTVTAFTVAHSLTLAGATLGFVHVPQKPVEACIALSIVFVATEIIHARQGWQGWTERWPWIVAFAFRPLNRIGFARRFPRIGFPPKGNSGAFLFFKFWVWIGPILFKSGNLGFNGLSAMLLPPPAETPAAWACPFPPKGIGGFPPS